MIADHAGQSARHRLIDHQAPGFTIVTRQNQAVRGDIGFGDLCLVDEAGEGGAGGLQVERRKLKVEGLGIEDNAASGSEFGT